MTTPTPASSSPAPSTVIGLRPAGFEPYTRLAEAVTGHRGILTAIAEHAEKEAARRALARETAAGADGH